AACRTRRRPATSHTAMAPLRFLADNPPARRFLVRRPGVATDMSNPTRGSILESNRAAGTRLELLLFRLGGRQLYGINVFKVQEVIHFRQLTRMPGANPLVSGIATLRGVTMPILDLSRAIGGVPLKNPEEGIIIITEYNRSVHGFLVGSVE